MRRAMIEVDGKVLKATVDDKGQALVNGQVVKPDAWKAPFSGTVFGIALNYQGLLDSKIAEFNQDPYKTPPKTPVLYIKTPNTVVGHEGNIVFPAGVDAIQAGPALGVVIGKRASRVSEAEAMDYVGGYTAVNEVTLPEVSFYRPAVKAKCRDTFCPVGPVVVDAADIKDPHALEIRLLVNGEVRQQNSTANFVRSIPELISFLSQFMTFEPGDLIITGVPEGRVDIAVGDKVEVEIAGLGRLSNTVVAE